MRKSLLTVVATFFGLAALCQSSKIDSLQRVLENADSDTARVSVLIKLTKQLGVGDSLGLIYAQEAYEVAKETGIAPYEARASANLGAELYFRKDETGIQLLNQAIEAYRSLSLDRKISDTYWNMSLVHEINLDYDSAIYYLQKSLEIAVEGDFLKEAADAHHRLAFIHNKRGNTSQALSQSLKAEQNYQDAGMPMEVSWARNQTGIIYDYMGLYSDALESYLSAHDIALEVKDADGDILILNNLGVLYDKMGNEDMALKYYEEALEKSGIFNYREDEATLLNNVSYIYLHQGDTAKAQDALWRAVKIIREEEFPCFEYYPLEGLGTLYLKLGELDSARYYLDQTVTKAIPCEDVGILTSAYKSQGELLAKTSRYSEGLRLLQKSLDLAKEANMTTERTDALESIYQLYKRRGNQTAALGALERLSWVKDSIDELRTIEKANQLAAEYEFRNEVESLKAERLASEISLQEKLKAQERERWFYIAGLILVVLLLGSMARSYYLIQKQNKKLKWLNEEKNTLMGVVAHDLRNPLNMIKGLMQVVVGVKTASDDDNSDQYLHLIRLSTQKMTDMIDKVLDISAIENMKVNLNMTKEDLSKLLSKSAQNFEMVAEKKRIRIERHFDEGANFPAEVDSNYFDQVMDNLLSNAIKFSEEGKKIYLDIKSDGEHQVVSVKDEGPGISEEEQSDLFNKFKTLKAKPTSNEQSTGLGLSIVKKFVTAMNGEIFCQSQQGEGTTFLLKFRVA